MGTYKDYINPEALKSLELIEDMTSKLGTLIDVYAKDADYKKMTKPLDIGCVYLSFRELRGKVDQLLKKVSAMETELTQHVVPRVFEANGTDYYKITSIGTAIGVSTRYRTTIKPEAKEEAYQWLRDNELGDLIKPGVNAETLSATFKELSEEELTFSPPSDLFNVYFQPVVSVRKI